MDLTATPDNPLPEDIRSGHFRAADGTRLRYAVCGHGAPRGTVCLLQGRGECIEKYFETIVDLRRRGYAVATFDWRGQGGSDRLLGNPLKGHVNSFRQYDADLEAFMRDVALPDCTPPFVALAHSTGAAVLLRALPTRTWFSRAVAIAPLLALHGSPLKRRLIALATWAGVLSGLSRIEAPGTGAGPLRREDAGRNPLTSDEARFLRICGIIEAAPALCVGKPTFGWLRAALSAMRALRRLPADQGLRTPVLLVVAGADTVVSNEACRDFAERVPGVAAVTVEHARHEILMERDVYREQFWAAFDAFAGEDMLLFPARQPPPSKAVAAS